MTVNFRMYKRWLRHYAIDVKGEEPLNRWVLIRLGLMLMFTRLKLSEGNYE